MGKRVENNENGLDGVEHNSQKILDTELVFQDKKFFQKQYFCHKVNM